MTGSINEEALWHLNRDSLATKALEQSPLSVERETGLLKTLDFLGQSADEKNVHDMLQIEEVFMKHALQFDANSPEEKKSLVAGIEQAAEAAKCLTLIMSNPQGYAAFSADLYGAREREAGLPLDPFRKFIKSQSARLSNRLAGEGSQNKKLILRQRKSNLSLIARRYMELQKKSLGLS